MDLAVSADQATRPRSLAAADTAFLGHPRGLAVLAFTEGWIGFSLYGMQSLLMLYMTDQLLRPGHIEHVIGFGTVLAMLRPIYGPLQGEPLASAINGLYVALVWAMPVLGGLLSDRFLGRTRTILLVCGLMTIGHFLLFFDASFLIGLACLIVGVGCSFCLQAQVGSLYSSSDTRRTDAFQLYSMAVNIAVVLSPLICGTLGETYAWHWGFAAAGCGMLIGLIVYFTGWNSLPPEPMIRPSRMQTQGPGPTRQDGRVLLVMALLLPVVGASLAGNTQIFNAYLVWAQQNYRLVFLGHGMPVSWLLSLDSATGIVTLLLSVLFWRWWERCHRVWNELVKMIMGATIMAVAPLILAFAAWNDDGKHAIGLEWGIAFHTVNSLGFANLYAVGMALYSRLAPRALGATLLNAYSLSIFLSNLLVSWLGGLLVRLPGDYFWLLHAAFVAAGALLLLIISVLFRDVVEPGKDDSPSFRTG